MQVMLCLLTMQHDKLSTCHVTSVKRGKFHGMILTAGRLVGGQTLCTKTLEHRKVVSITEKYLELLPNNTDHNKVGT